MPFITPSVCVCVIGLSLQPLLVSVCVQCALLPGHRPLSRHLRGCGVDRSQSGQRAPPQPAQQDHPGPHEVRRSARLCVCLCARACVCVPYDV